MPVGSLLITPLIVSGDTGTKLLFKEAK